MKVHITSYADTEARSVAEKLRGLYELSNKTHTLVGNADEADLILVGGLGNEIGEEQYLRTVIEHELISRYPGKCFTLSYRDVPLVFNRGIYESSVRSWLGFGRVRTGSYALSGSCNCFVKAHGAARKASVPKRYLFSFIGRDSNAVRRQLFSLQFKRPDIHIEDSSDFLFWACDDAREKERRQRHYFDVLMQSKFALCPRGAGTGSIRLFEAMQCGVAPVIISDDWILPSGVPWKDCAVFVSEKDVGSLEEILRACEDQHAEIGAQAQKAFEAFFDDSRYFNYVVRNCAEMMQAQPVPEALIWRMRGVFTGAIRLKRRAGSMLRKIRTQ